MAGVYTVTVSNASGCKTTATVNVTVTTPTTSAANTGPYCPGQTISLTTPAATSYTWTGPNAFTSNLQNPTIANSTTVMSGVYTVTSTTGACKATATTAVLVNPAPTPTASNTGPYCPGNTIQLNVGSFTTYTWSGPSTFSSNAQNPTQANAAVTNSGNYTVIVTSAQGCTNTAVTNVIVNPTPTVGIGSNSPICLNNPINLTSSGGTGYSWSGPNAFTSALQNPTIPAATAVNAGVYTVTVTSLGCTNTGTVSVTVTTPTTSAANTGPYCVGATINLSAPSATSYTWTGPGGFTSGSQNPTNPATVANAGTYSVIVTIGTCTASATTSVVVNALPTPVAANTGPYCPGNTINLSVGAFNTYTWSGPSAFSSNVQNASQSNAQTTNAGVYTVSVTDANGCVNSATTNVVVNPTPTVVIGSNSPICINNNLNLTASGGTGYSWSGPNAFTSALQNPTIPAATAVNGGVYTVTVTALGCTNTGTVSVTVTTPTTSAANTGPYCAGSTINLSSPSATSYTWTGPGGFTSSSQNPTNSATALTAGTYSVIVTIGTCTASATTSVVVNPLPAPVANNTGAYCPGNTIQLNVGAFNTYTWSGPSAFSSNSQNPTQTNAQTTNAGVYTVSVTDANGCVNTATTNVVVNPTPVPVLGSNSPVCINNSINLTATGGTSYQWSGPNSFSSSNQNPTIPNATALEAGVYTVSVTSLGCVGAGTINVIVTTPTTSAANSGPFCAGTTINLSAPAATSYTWSGPGGFTSNAQNPTNPNATLAMSGTYSVIVTIGTCTASATTSVIVNPLPAPVANNTGAYCPGNTIQLNVGAFNTYTWSGPSAFSSNAQNPTQANAQTTNSGVYTVSVTDANGCVNTTTTNVVVNPNPVAVLGSNSPVCINTSINLTANGGTSYQWSGPNNFSTTNQNPTIPNATALDAGVYSVTVTSLGCTGVGTINVAVTNPSTSAANTGPYCAGTTINLTAPSATSYTWSGPAGFSSNAQNPSQSGATTLMTGTYTVIVSISSCTAIATTNVLVNPLPIPNIVSNSPVCAGQAINLTGSGGTTYTWTGPGSFNSNSATPSIGSSSSTNAGNYVLTVTDANGCVNSTNTNVVVNALPIINVNNPTNCQNTSINLTANGAVTYTWSGPGGFTSNAQNPTIPTAQLSNTGAYTVMATDANGCVNIAVANASVIALPVPNANVAGPVCVGGTLVFTASGGTSYSWSGPNSFSSNSQNPNVSSATLPAGGTYTLIVTANTCTASTTVAAVVNPLPTPNIITNSPLCVGAALNLTGSGGSTYSWSGPGGFTSTSQNPSIPSTTLSNGGTYTLTVIDANGCTASTNANVVVNALPNPIANGVSLCENNNGNLSASGGTSYSWSGPGGFTSTQQNPSISNVQMANAGQYTVVVTNANNCSSTAIANVVVNPAPTPSIITNSPICMNQAMSLSGTGGVTYQWSGPNGFFSTSQTATFVASSTAYSGNYNLTVIDANGCTASTSAAALINPIPNANVVANYNKSCAPSCVTFTCSSTSAIVNYGWTMGNGGGGDNAPVATSCYTKDGTYTITTTVVDANGCYNTATTTVEVYPQPVADFNHAPIKPIVNIDQEVTFTDASWNTPIVSWNWYFMNTAQYTSTLQNPTFSYTEPGTYAVALVVKSDHGCTDTIVRPLVVGEDFGIYVPNAFTPNGDGLNDLFQPKGFGVVTYELNIYDRWGEKVFHTEKFEEGWDGKFQGRGGEIIEEGAYTWLINCTSVFGKAHELKGHVTLIK